MTKTAPVWLLLILLGFPQFSENIYSPALPTMAHALATSNTLAQWTLTLYFIGFAVGVFSFGRLSDHLGRRVAILSGLAVYALGALLCALSHSIDVLLFARLVQGFGGSACSVVGQAIAREALHDSQRHQFFSLSGVVLAVCITVGPFVGGYLTQWFAWESNFVLLLIFGLAILWACTIRLPETRAKEMVVFAVWPVLKRMLCDARVLSASGLVGIMNGILFSYYAQGPFIFIKMLHFTPIQFGRLGLLLAFSALSAGFVSRRLSKHLGYKALLMLGGVLMLLCSAAMLLFVLLGWVSDNHPIVSLVLIMLPMMGLVFSTYGFVTPIALGQALVHYKEALGTAGAVFGLSYYLLVSLITAVMAWLGHLGLAAMPAYFFALSLVSLLLLYRLACCLNV